VFDRVLQTGLAELPWDLVICSRTVSNGVTLPSLHKRIIATIKDDRKFDGVFPGDMK
jgi:hypothetical protein